MLNQYFAKKNGYNHVCDIQTETVCVKEKIYATTNSLAYSVQIISESEWEHASFMRFTSSEKLKTKPFTSIHESHN